MMVPFLEKTSDYILSHFGNDLSEIAVVLPNRRAGLFLRKYLAAKIGRTGWAPNIWSIEDFISELSGLREAELLSLLIDLYGIHREVEGEKAQPFGEYLNWAPQLLADFNEIDRYMVDAAQLFSYLDEARVLSVWNLENQPLTEFETRYLQFYHSLAGYYQAFTKLLLGKGQGYQGLIFRHAAGQVSGSVHSVPWKQVVFAGFNALTRAEETIIREFYRNHKAVLLWDADPYYLNNDQQEAGTFLREWIRKWPADELSWVSDDYASGSKDIRIIGAPDAIGQVKLCGQLLSGTATAGEEEKSTAVVLLDESLLVPLLNSLPDEVDALNITAGLPLRQTPLAGLFESVFRMHINTAGFSYLAGKGKGKYYYKDLLQVMQHPLMYRMAGGVSGNSHPAFDSAIDSLRTGSRIFAGMDELEKGVQDLFSGSLAFMETVLRPWDSPDDILACFISLIEQLRLLWPVPAEGNGRNTRIEPEYLYAYSKIFHQLSNLTGKIPGVLTTETFYQLYRQISDATSLPFYGEPLKGIQVMGMLETRTLDFDHVILVSCNDDLLPSGRINPSFIPFDIKRHFDLPTYRHKDAVYAYHFYRLLQRASTVTVLYVSEPDALGGGEPSRFLKQAAHEMPAYNSNIRISQEILATPAPKGKTPAVFSVPKTGEVLELMLARASRGLAPTAINAFRTCPLKFYLSEIAGIREPDDIDDTIDPKVLGNAIHEALHTLYRPYAGKQLTAGMTEAMQKESDNAVESAFLEKYKGSEVQYGKNLLLINVAKMLVMRYLKSQEQEILEKAGTGPFVEFLEQPLLKKIMIRYGDGELEVLTKGFADRIDRREGTWEIIDYKTGLTDKKLVRIKDWEQLATDPDLNFGFQLLMYAWLLQAKLGRPVTVKAGTVSLKKLANNMTTVEVPAPGGESLTEILDGYAFDRFSEVLHGILADIFDTSVPFSQTENTAVCERCPYVNLCCR